MLHCIFKIDKICWNGFQEEPVLKLTGREAVEYFAKCHHIGKIQSIYFNIAETRHFRPYDLISVHKNKVRYLIAKWYEYVKYLLILYWKLGFNLFRLMVSLEYRKVIACRLLKFKTFFFNHLILQMCIWYSVLLSVLLMTSFRHAILYTS